MAQDTCWHLSKLGESCASTCERFNETFFFVLADRLNPVIPTLVGHEPNVKQEPWAALECYAPPEDRYHTANENATKHFEGDLGAFSKPECKLACPCTSTAAVPV